MNPEFSDQAMRDAEAAKEGNRNAFPTLDDSGGGLHCREFGLSKRELFAAMALQGWIASLGLRRHEAGYSDIGAAYEAAQLAASTADALLTELARATK